MAKKQPYTEARKAANLRYFQTMERLYILLKPAEKQAVRDAAKRKGVSVASFAKERVLDGLIIPGSDTTDKS